MPRTNNPFPFLSLPPEIRLKIYRFVCFSPTHVPLSPVPNWPLEFWDHRPPLPAYPENLLLTCHQIYHEVRGLYFNTNRFDMLLSRAEYSSLFVFNPSFRDNLRRIRTLRLRIWRWGSNDGFVSVLVPMVEDMILNGALRDLEVWVKWRDLSGFAWLGKWVGRKEDLNPGLGMVPNVQALFRLCEDPYLESVRLVAFGAKDIKMLVLGIEEGTGLPKDVSFLIDRGGQLKSIPGK